jgi:acyl-CoA thioesterase FadM
MPRLEIEFPEEALFRTELPIRIDDVNYGGHLGNDKVLAIAQEARLRFLAAHGFPSELDVAGTGLIMADAAVVYRGEGVYGMVLEVELAASGVRTRGFDFLYRMRDARTGREIARARTGMLWFDYAARKVVSMPEAFRRALGEARPPTGGAPQGRS